MDKAPIKTCIEWSCSAAEAGFYFVKAQATGRVKKTLRIKVPADRIRDAVYTLGNHLRELDAQQARIQYGALH